MPNTNSQLLTSTEILDIYGMPSLNETERQEYFTLNQKELQLLKSFNDTVNAVYFATCLVFFKIKLTFVDFAYQNITLERQHIMERYFPGKPYPRCLPENRSTIARIQKHVLELCNYNRFSGTMVVPLKKELLQQATNHPRQRQLCKAFLDLLSKHRISTPGYSTIQDIITEIWNTANTHLTASYLRYTNKSQRDSVGALLDKSDNCHEIISIRQDMKGFNTTELKNELDKHNRLKQIFETAKEILPKLRLPTATINYYASLVNYYNGARLKQINKNTAQFYLLCYCYIRYQSLNDNLLEALKKRTREYETKAKIYANEQALKQIDSIKDIKKRISNMLISIKYYPDPRNIPKKALYKHIPENELLNAAKLLVDENLDKDFLFWKYIDAVEESIKRNLRNIFLTLDLVVTNNETLAAAINYMKLSMGNDLCTKPPLPSFVETWVKNSKHEHLLNGDEIVRNRFEFYLYIQIVHHISTNKLTLEHTIKHKKVDDDLMPNDHWRKNKKKTLKKLDYTKLQAPIHKTLKTMRRELDYLYKLVNESIFSGENKGVKITTNQTGEKQWRLRPLESLSDPGESILAEFQQRSVVDVIHFVDSKTKFTKSFESILPKYKRGKQDAELITAVVLANAIRIGARKISTISDLNESSLITAETAYIRKETLIAAANAVNEAAAKLPIYKEWYIDSILHGSIDGMKEESSLQNIFTRYSKKYFGQGVGVSAYNEIVNSFPIAGNLIGANEYEGSFAFEMVHHQNTSEIKPERISTDKHGTNSLNFGLFDLTEILFAPRIPKPHRETFWGFDNTKDYSDFIIKPSKFFKEDSFVDEWDNVQRLVASLLTGDAPPSILVRKLSSKDYNSPTKKAFVQYNNIVKSKFLLMFIHDSEFRRAIMIALNRGEAYNALYRAIAVYNKGELRGQSEIEMGIWHQCARLVSSIILYYNTYILNALHMSAKTKTEKKILVDTSPCAWSHINLLGYYQFCIGFSEKAIDRLIKQWDWRKQG